jgi:tetratricopeptide (TPR) repeat protein
MPPVYPTDLQSFLPDEVEAERVRVGGIRLRTKTWLIIFASLLLLAGCDTFRQAPVTPAPLIVRPTLAPNTTRTPAQAELDKGDELFNQGDLQGAIGAYTQAIHLAPDYPEAYNNRGYAYWRLNNETAAMADFSKAIALHPDYVNALTNRAFIDFDQGNMEQTISDTNHAIAIDTADDSAYVMRGNARMRQGDWADGISDFLEANRIRQARKAA